MKLFSYESAKKSEKTNVVAISSKAKARSGKLSATEQACADMEAKMQALHVQHTAFHTQYVERSNAALYALLADMQRVCLDLLELQLLVVPHTKNLVKLKWADRPNK